MAYNNTLYGKGSEIIYDFERIQKNLLRGVHLLKQFDKEKMKFISYQFELLN